MNPKVGQCLEKSNSVPEDKKPVFIWWNFTKVWKMYKQEFHQICRLKFCPFLLFQEFCSFKLHSVKHMEELAEEYITALSESCLYVYHCATIYLQFIYGQKCLDTHTSHLYAIVEHLFSKPWTFICCYDILHTSGKAGTWLQGFASIRPHVGRIGHWSWRGFHKNICHRFSSRLLSQTLFSEILCAIVIRFPFIGTKGPSPNNKKTWIKSNKRPRCPHTHIHISHFTLHICLVTCFFNHIVLPVNVTSIELIPTSDRVRVKIKWMAHTPAVQLPWSRHI